jgi:hypothetical protein
MNTIFPPPVLTPPTSETLSKKVYSSLAKPSFLRTKMSANDVQHGGNHYKQFKGYEPWDVITAWGLGYLDGTALKYIARWKHKNGVEDLKKAVHFLQKTIEVYESNQE